MTELEQQRSLLNFSPKFNKFDICYKWKWNKNGKYTKENPNTKKIVIIDEVSINIRNNYIDCSYSIVDKNKDKGSWYDDDFLDFIKKANEKDLKYFYENK